MKITMQLKTVNLQHRNVLNEWFVVSIIFAPLNLKRRKPKSFIILADYMTVQYSARNVVHPNFIHM
jgi:hypothetical protein